MAEFIKNLHATAWVFTFGATVLGSFFAKEAGTALPEWYPTAFFWALALTLLSFVWIIIPDEERMAARRERRRAARCLGTVRILPGGGYILVQGEREVYSLENMSRHGGGLQ